jgi:hypothetical protein
MGSIHLALRTLVTVFHHGTRHGAGFAELEAHFERRLNPSSALTEANERIFISPTDTRERYLIPI